MGPRPSLPAPASEVGESVRGTIEQVRFSESGWLRATAPGNFRCVVVVAIAAIAGLGHDRPAVAGSVDEPSVIVSCAIDDAGSSQDVPQLRELVASTLPAAEVSLVPVSHHVLPVDLVGRPSDPEAVYVLEQLGTIHRVATDGSSSRVVADLSALTNWGVLGLEFSSDGTHAYVYYRDISDRSVVAEYAVSDDGQFEIESERQVWVLEFDQRTEHVAGDLHFGPDGLLYIAVGDGGTGAAADGGEGAVRAADAHDPRGSMLRIDPTASGGQPYSIPPDNPFSDGSQGAPEVWSWGLRNPWRFDFDTLTGDLWVADVGLITYEEVSVAHRTSDEFAGKAVNFGWGRFEGCSLLNEDLEAPGTLNFPVIAYPRAFGCSISGGAVYRGSEFDWLDGAFVYGDFCTGTVWAYVPESNNVFAIAQAAGSVSAVRRGLDGELYVLDHSGGDVSRLVAGT